jgi:creatinine amidohydrolase/Fe(II)-dependent formamide hydrolase-like protein
VARQRFRLIVLLSTHGGNGPGLRAAVRALDHEGLGVQAPRGDIGPNPGAHSGEWITSVMLALHPDLVQLEQADERVVNELRIASTERGREHLERFVNAVIRELG